MLAEGGSKLHRLARGQLAGNLGVSNFGHNAEFWLLRTVY